MRDLEVYEIDKVYGGLSASQTSSPPPLVDIPWSDLPAGFAQPANPVGGFHVVMAPIRILMTTMVILDTYRDTQEHEQKLQATENALEELNDVGIISDTKLDALNSIPTYFNPFGSDDDGNGAFVAYDGITSESDAIDKLGAFLAPFGYEAGVEDGKDVFILASDQSDNGGDLPAKLVVEDHSVVDQYQDWLTTAVPSSEFSNEGIELDVRFFDANDEPRNAGSFDFLRIPVTFDTQTILQTSTKLSDEDILTAGEAFMLEEGYHRTALMTSDGNSVYTNSDGLLVQVKQEDTSYYLPSRDDFDFGGSINPSTIPGDPDDLVLQFDLIATQVGFDAIDLPSELPEIGDTFQSFEEFESLGFVEVASNYQNSVSLYAILTETGFHYFSAEQTDSGINLTDLADRPEIDKIHNEDTGVIMTPSSSGQGDETQRHEIGIKPSVETIDEFVDRTYTLLEDNGYTTLHDQLDSNGNPLIRFDGINYENGKPHFETKYFVLNFEANSYDFDSFVNSAYEKTMYAQLVSVDINDPNDITNKSEPIPDVGLIDIASYLQDSAVANLQMGDLVTGYYDNDRRALTGVHNHLVNDLGFEVIFANGSVIDLDEGRAGYQVRADMVLQYTFADGSIEMFSLIRTERDDGRVAYGINPGSELPH